MASSSWLPVAFSWLCVLLELRLTRVMSSFEEGYCQVYSYNIKNRRTGLSEKHFFSCCNNMEEKSCQGNTYQKPSRTESFCSGEVIEKEGSHWTQMEQSAFPEQGKFYCGDCCGQHIAWDACTDQWRRGPPGCINWVQCFQRECRKVVAAIVANKPLDCGLPPAPHPKHFRQEPRTLPANLTVEFTTSRTPSPAQAQHSHNATCSDTWCASISREQKCRMHCCVKHCCLPDGTQTGHGSLMWGLSTVQVVGIALGSAALLAALAAIVVLLARRCCAPGTCKHFKFHPADTQILVIEGPEEADEDEEDTDPEDAT